MLEKILKKDSSTVLRIYRQNYTEMQNLFHECSQGDLLYRLTLKLFDTKTHISRPIIGLVQNQCLCKEWPDAKEKPHIRHLA